MTRRTLGSLLAAIAWLVALAPGVLAHAGGVSGAAQADVSVPGWVLWGAGALLVGLSFAIVGLVLTREDTIEIHEASPVDAGTVTALDRGWVTLGRIAGLVGFALVAAPTLLPFVDGWAAVRILWLGVWTLGPLVTYLGVNVWAVASPFRALAGLADRLRGDNPRMAYPSWLSAWPSVVLLLAVFGFEATQGAAFGNAVSLAALGYTAFTLGGMMVFGSQVWLARVEVFDRVFAWWGTMAPVELSEHGLRKRSPFARLGRARAADRSDASFFVALLYGVNFDGFLATAPGQAAVTKLAGFTLPGAKAVVLVAGYALFLAVFWATVWAIRKAAGSLRSLEAIGTRFAVTLLPIAAGYHLAHSVPDLVLSTPLVLETLADPLALGAATATAWSVPAGAGVYVVGLEMLVIVLAHVFAVLAAHRVAFGAFASRVQAVKSELPLTALMVVYTFVGLWLVARASHAGVGL